MASPSAWLSYAERTSKSAIFDISEKYTKLKHAHHEALLRYCTCLAYGRSVPLSCIAKMKYLAAIFRWLSVMYFSLMQASCDVAFKYAHEREQFGQKIGTFQVSDSLKFVWVFTVF